jgi:hypothetical protein
VDGILYKRYCDHMVAVLIGAAGTLGCTREHLQIMLQHRGLQRHDLNPANVHMRVTQ